MDFVFSLLAWTLQLGITLLLALALGAGIRALLKKKRKLWPFVLAALILIWAVLAGCALRPPVTCPEEAEQFYTPELQRAVESVSRGLYSDRLPLVPVWVEVRETTSLHWSKVQFTIHYFPIGTVEMTYSSRDGYNITKPLN